MVKVKPAKRSKGPELAQASRGEAVPDKLQLLATPVGFARAVLGIKPYAWQEEVMNWYANCRERVKGTVGTPNEAGKSSVVIPGLALWWVTVCGPLARVVITSKDAKQLDNQVWPAIERFRAKFPGYKFREREVETPTGGMVIGFTTDEAGRAEGWHSLKNSDGEIIGPLLYILDEAKSIAEPIFQATDRCSFQGLLYISSTGLMQGRFYESHTSQSDNFRCRKVRLDECPHISKERIADVIRTYGEDHPFTRSTLYSEFMSQDGASAFFVTLEAYEKCIQSPPDYKPGDRVAFCDFAGGRGENVLAVREGNRVRIIRSWREANEMSAIGEFIREFRKEGLRAEEIWGDNAGLGKGMIARFAELGWPINRFNAGERAFNDHDFFNRNSEVWHNAAQMIKKGEVILPEDATLKAQICSRRIGGKDGRVDSRGRLKCEPKEEMIKRGLKSPDRADAVVGCMALRQMRGLAKEDAITSSWRARMAEELEENIWGEQLCDVGVMPGGWNT